MIEELKRKNGTSYRARIYWLDGSVLSETFRSKTLAKEWERKKLNERDQIRASGGVQVQDSLTFNEFADRWMKEKIETRYSLSTQRYYEQVLRGHLRPYFGARMLRDLRIEHGHKFVILLKSHGRNPEGVNRIVSVLRALLNDAVRWQCLGSNPIQGMGSVKNMVKHDSYLTEQEIAQLLRANLREPIYPFLVCALNTGMRRGELGGLLWDRVDFARGQIAITRVFDRWGLRDTTKSGKKRVIPMNMEVRRVLEPLWKAQKSRHVFCEPSGEPLDIHHFGRDFKRALKKAGLGTDFRLHDLRHTFASQFMMKGGNIYDLQKILGHYALEMTQRYAHLSPDHLADAISIVGFSGLSEEEKAAELGNLDPEQKAHNPYFLQKIR